MTGPVGVDLISVASAAGHEAEHVARVGKAGWKDWNVASYASESDFVLVTNNASDFRDPSVDRILQSRLFCAAIEALAMSNDRVNCVLEIDIDGDEVTLDLYDLPS